MLSNTNSCTNTHVLESNGTGIAFLIKASFFSKQSIDIISN